jgi:hypothetical protein
MASHAAETVRVAIPLYMHAREGVRGFTGPVEQPLAHGVARGGARVLRGGQRGVQQQLPLLPVHLQYNPIAGSVGCHSDPLREKGEKGSVGCQGFLIGYLKLQEG